MLYALTQEELARVRAGFVPQLVGAEMLWAAYRTDPAAVARILPHPLRPLPEPLALAFVARYPETNFGSVYREGALLLGCTFRGRTGAYCLAMPVDDDNALVCGRELYAYPKKMGEISLERRGGAIVGRVARRGAQILRIEAALGDAAGEAELAPVGAAGVDGGRPCRRLTSYNFKFFPTSDGTGFDYLPRLLEHELVLRPRAGVLRGSARVAVASTPFDPLGEVPVLGDAVAAMYGTFDVTMLPARVAARAWNVWRFLPHSCFKLDAIPVALGDVDRARGASPAAVAR